MFSTFAYCEVCYCLMLRKDECNGAKCLEKEVEHFFLMVQSDGEHL